MIEEKRKKLSTHGKFLAPTVLFIRPEVRHYLTSNSLLFLGDQTSLLDSGYQYQGDQLKKIRDAIDIDGILFSHYHIDHVFGCHILPESKKMIHKEEVDTMRSFDNFIQFCFKDQTISSQQRNIWKLRFKNLLKREGINDWSDLRLDNVISFGSNENIDLGVTQLQILHLPGHSPGHCGVYETENQILFIGDIDLSGKFWPLVWLVEFRTRYFHKVGGVRYRYCFQKRNLQKSVKLYT